MKAIINAELIMRDHLIPEAVLLIEDGKIAGFGEMRNTEIPAGAEIIDVNGAYVGPGFVDIHVHAGAGVRFLDDPITAAKAHLAHGSTTVLPAPFGRSTAQEIIQACHDIRAAMQTPDGANIGGMYMETPYTNPKYGSNRAKNPWNKPIDKNDYVPILNAAKDLAKVWCVAPERENIEEFVLAARAVNPTVRFAVAHSEATPQEIEALMPYGLCIGTHHTNATGTIIKYPECRGVCVDEAVNYHHDIYAELICDSRGIHVDPYMLRLVRKIKGDDRIILISDATHSDAPNPPGYEGVNDINFDYEGEIAGSKLTLDVACRNMMKHTGASIVNVFQFASYNPARAVGFTDRGEIRVGLRADLIVVDHKMNVQRVYLQGEEAVLK